MAFTTTLQRTSYFPLFTHKRANSPTRLPITSYFSIPLAHRVHKAIRSAIITSPERETESPSIFSELFPPRQLLVPKLPHPPFHMNAPSHILSPATIHGNDTYAPPCLLGEVEREIPIQSNLDKTLPKQGTLRQNHQGLVYLEVPQFPFHSDTPPLRNAHEPHHPYIPIILPKEFAERKGHGQIEGLDQDFTFTITGVYAVKPTLWPEMETIWYAEVNIPQLEVLREKLMLPTKINSHPFTMIIGVKRKSVGVKKPETYRLNVSCYVA